MTDKELGRNAARRLAIIRHAQEVTGNVALTCRYYGIAGRCSPGGCTATRPQGLQACVTGRNGRRTARTRPRPRWSRRSSTCARTTTSARRNLYVPPALPRHRGQQLRGLADPQAAGPEPAPGLRRYKRHDRKWKRYEKPMPGHAIQVNVKFIAPLSSGAGRSTTSSPPSTTARGCGCCGSTTG